MQIRADIIAHIDIHRLGRAAGDGHLDIVFIRLHRRADLAVHRHGLLRRSGRGYRLYDGRRRYGLNLFGLLDCRFDLFGHRFDFLDLFDHRFDLFDLLDHRSNLFDLFGRRFDLFDLLDHRSNLFDLFSRWFDLLDLLEHRSNLLGLRLNFFYERLALFDCSHGHNQLDKRLFSLIDGLCQRAKGHTAAQHRQTQRSSQRPLHIFHFTVPPYASSEALLHLSMFSPIMQPISGACSF